MDLKLVSNDILIDLERVNKSTKGYDSKEYKQFIKNKNKVDPIYLERDIQYNFNGQGYRTKNLEDLDKDFVLVFGCSHTEGIGNFEEDIWHNQLLHKYSIDCFNLAKASTGPDIQYINTVQYIKNQFPTPRLVIYQWPQTFRRSFSYKRDDCTILKHHNVHNQVEKKDTNWYLKRYCIELGEMSTNNYMHYYTSNMLWQQLNVPVLNWSWTGDFECDFDNLYIIETEDTGRARDLMHDGPDIHRQVAEQLTPILDKLI